MIASNHLKNKFKNIEFISSGTYGSVYEVLHNEKKYAIKTQSIDPENGIIGNVLRELYILKHIRHPSIVKLYNIFHTEKFVDLLMEKYPTDLYKMISTTSWQERRIHFDKIIFKLLDVLQCLHENKIYHLDVKSHNILVRDYDVVICDFGLSSTKSMDWNESYLCSIHCRPPELLARLKIPKDENILMKIDVWSLGCVLLEYVIGRLPFEIGTESVVLHSILREEGLTECQFLGVSKVFGVKKNVWEKLYKLAPEWYMLIKNMLTINYKHRPTLKECWDQFLRTSTEQFERLHYRVIHTDKPRQKLDMETIGLLKRVSERLNAEKCNDDVMYLFQISLLEPELEGYSVKVIAACCFYIVLKFRYYDYCELKDIVTDEKTSKLILKIEPIILKSCDYSIQKI
jgi:serine/threonine protein kinase